MGKKAKKRRAWSVVRPGKVYVPWLSPQDALAIRETINSHLLLGRLPPHLEQYLVEPPTTLESKYKQGEGC